MHVFFIVFLRPGRTAQLYFSAPAELCIVFSDPPSLAKNGGQTSGQTHAQNLDENSGTLTFLEQLLCNGEV